MSQNKMPTKYKIEWRCPVCFHDCEYDPKLLYYHLDGGHSKDDLVRYVFCKKILDFEELNEP